MISAFRSNTRAAYSHESHAFIHPSSSAAAGHAANGEHDAYAYHHQHQHHPIIPQAHTAAGLQVDPRDMGYYSTYYQADHYVDDENDPDNDEHYNGDGEPNDDGNRMLAHQGDGGNDQPAERSRELHIPYDVIQRCFFLPLGEASEQLRVSRSTMKRICRQHEIRCWPYRKIRALVKRLEVSQAAMLSLRLNIQQQLLYRKQFVDLYNAIEMVLEDANAEVSLKQLRLLDDDGLLVAGTEEAQELADLVAAIAAGDDSLLQPVLPSPEVAFLLESIKIALMNNPSFRSQWFGERNNAASSSSRRGSGSKRKEITPAVATVAPVPSQDHQDNNPSPEEGTPSAEFLVAGHNPTLITSSASETLPAPVPVPTPQPPTKQKKKQRQKEPLPQHQQKQQQRLWSGPQYNSVVIPSTTVLVTPVGVGGTCADRSVLQYRPTSGYRVAPIVGDSKVEVVAYEDPTDMRGFGVCFVSPVMLLPLPAVPILPIEVIDGTVLRPVLREPDVCSIQAMDFPPSCVLFQSEVS